MTDPVAGKTVRVDVAQGVSEPAGPPEALFNTASADGSKVFFTDGKALTADSTANGGVSQDSGMYGDLYVYEADTGKLTDLSVDHNAGETAHVQGLAVAASEDGSHLFFVAKGALAPGAVAGKDNLYLAHDEAGAWITTFVATLSIEDSPGWGIGGISHGNPEGGGPSVGYLSMRSSPDGRYLAFMSTQSLTGYDNRDLINGKPDTEVFLYDAATSHLACVSCNPTGERPTGILDEGDSFNITKFEEKGETQELLVDSRGAWERGWLSGSIPEWDYMEGNAYYQSRYLSDNGRLFFDSDEGLIAQDTNGTGDVYEYEPVEGAEAPASDNCTAASQTYSQSSGGCVSLISSGSSPVESAFIDASGSGDDVFFLTAERLVPADFDNALDVYDARVCSEAAPCSTTPVSSPPCTSGDSCKAAPSPQPSLFGDPPSATFSGVGNVPGSNGTVQTKAKQKKTKSKKKPKHGKKKPKHVKAKVKHAKRASNSGRGRSSRADGRQK